MKIVIDARLYGVENGGLGRYLSNLIEQISRIDKKNNYVVLLRSKYFTQISLPKNWKKVKVDIKHYSFLEQLVIPWVLYRQKADIVHFPHFNVPVLYFGRYIVTIHDLLMHQFKSNSTSTLPWLLYIVRRLGYNLAFSKAVKGSTHIIVPSFFVKKDLLLHFHIKSSKVSYVYEGVDPHLKQSKNKAIRPTVKSLLSGKFFLYVGNAYPHKNLIAFKDMLSKISGASVVMVIPRDTFMERLRKLYEPEIGKGQVFLLNRLSDTELASLYKKCQAFIFPSLSEGFGLPGLEALSFGALVLASDIPVFREVYRDLPLYFDPQNPATLTGLVKKVRKMNLIEKNKYALRAKKFVHHYSWKKLAQKTVEIYAKV